MTSRSQIVIARQVEPTVIDPSGGCVAAPTVEVREFRVTGVAPF